MTSTANHHHVEEHNRGAGRGAVLLDIGDEIGALVVHAPADLVGVEIEICPAGEQRSARHRPHVAVVARTTPDGCAPTAVFASLPTGRYELYRKPDGPTELQARVDGGRVQEVRWPG